MQFARFTADGTDETAATECGGRRVNGGIACGVLRWGFGLSCAAWLVVLQRGASPLEHWLAAVVLVAGVAATVAGIERELPLQSVLTVTVLTALICWLVLAVNAKIGLPLGPVVYGDETGPRLSGALPCALPFVWTLVILNSRGVARVIVLRRGNLSNPGLWTIGIASLLAVVTDFSLEPFAAATGRFWFWRSTSDTPAWQVAPLLNYAGWFCITMFVLVCLTPWIIKKKPAAVSSANFQPLWLWLVTNLFMVAANALHNFRTAAVIGLLVCLTVATMSLRRLPR